MIHIKIDGHCLTATTDDKLVAKCVNTVYFDAAFDDSWDGYEKRLVFSANRNPGVPVTYTGGAMLVPWNALDASGWLYISAVGLAEGKRDVTSMMHTPLFVYANGDLGDDSTAPDYDPSPLESAVLACAKSAKEAEDAARRAEDAARRAEDAIPTEPGGAGRDGGHYTPMVTQPDSGRMRMSFSPSREDMPSVPDAEVKLPAGPAGHTPVKGEDYWTPEEKQEIVHDVLDEIPEGGDNQIELLFSGSVNDGDEPLKGIKYNLPDGYKKYIITGYCALPRDGTVSANEVFYSYVKTDAGPKRYGNFWDSYNGKKAGYFTYELTVINGYVRQSHAYSDAFGKWGTYRTSNFNNKIDKATITGWNNFSFERTFDVGSYWEVLGVK